MIRSCTLRSRDNTVSEIQKRLMTIALRLKVDKKQLNVQSILRMSIQSNAGRMTWLTAAREIMHTNCSIWHHKLCIIVIIDFCFRIYDKLIYLDRMLSRECIKQNLIHRNGFSAFANFSLSGNIWWHWTIGSIWMDSI